MNRYTARVRNFAAFLLPRLALVAGAVHCSGGPTSADETPQASSQAATTSGGSSSGVAQLPTVVGDVMLWNSTPWPLLLTNARAFGNWLPTKSNNPCQTLPSGAPPGIAPPDGAEVEWESYGPGSTSGAVTLSVLDVTGSQPTPPTVIGTLQWSGSPLGSGGEVAEGGASDCSAIFQPATPDPFASSPFSVVATGWSITAGQCWYTVRVNNGPSLAAKQPPSLTAGQAVVFANDPLASSDKTTIVDVQKSSPTACNLSASYQGVTTPLGSGAVMGIMEGNGNFVAYNLLGQDVWSTTAPATPGAWFEVESGVLKILGYSEFKNHLIVKTLWEETLP